MKYTFYSFRNAEILLNQPEYCQPFNEIIDTLNSITDEDLCAVFERLSSEKKMKSLSVTINEILIEKLTALGWNEQSEIFADEEFRENSKQGIWRLDFAKGPVALEVAFNHGGNISWNLIKPVLSSEYNHVRKAIQTDIGIVITATKTLKEKGGFDPAVGSFEKFISFLRPLNRILSVPILIIGLLPPETFYIKQEIINNKKIGRIHRI